MNKLLQRYPDVGQSETLSAHDPGIKNNLINQRDLLQARLDKINAALEALNKQPEVAELLETVMKAL